MPRSYDLITLLADAGFSTTVVSNGGELRLACPLCSDHKERMFINRRTYLWSCHNCDEAGNLYRLLELVLDLDPVEIYRVVQNLDDRVRKAVVEVPAEAPEVELPPGVPLRNINSLIEQPFWDYLRGPTRRVAIQDVIEYDMRACVAGRYGMRVIVPVRQEGRVVSFVARAITDHCPCPLDPCPHRWVKVLYPVGTQQSKILFNLDRVSGQDEVVLVEGAFDAIRLKDRAVATLGAHLSAYQRSLLKAHGIENVVIMWDADGAGRRATRRAARELIAGGFGVRIATIPTGVDPAQASNVDLTFSLAQAANEPILCSSVQLDRRLRRREQTPEETNGQVR